MEKEKIEIIIFMGKEGSGVEKIKDSFLKYPNVSELKRIKVGEDISSEDFLSKLLSNEIVEAVSEKSCVYGTDISSCQPRG